MTVLAQEELDLSRVAGGSAVDTIEEIIRGFDAIFNPHGLHCVVMQRSGKLYLEILKLEQ